MTISEALAGRARKGRTPLLPFVFDLQLHAGNEDDDDLGDPPSIDINALSDDPAQLKQTIRQLMGDNRTVRKEAAKRRTALRTAETAAEKLKTEHATAIETIKGEHKTATESALEKLRGEHKTAFDELMGKHDGIVKERDEFKGQNETLNRSNGQLRGRFREQFVDQRVRNELEKRGAHNVDDAMKLLDVGKFDFDEEKLTLKDEKAFTDALDAFSKERTYLFGTPKPTPRGTTPARGSSDNSGGGGGGSTKAFDNDKRSTDDIMSDVLAGIGITG